VVSPSICILNLTKTQTTKDTAKFKVNLKDEKFSNLGEVEIVDMAQGFEPTPYASLAPRDYRKLHSLHTSIQPDKAARLPKRKPEFPYSRGEKPYLPFLHKDENMAGVLDSTNSEGEDFPSPSKLGQTAFARKPSPDPFESFTLEGEKAVPSWFPDASLSSLEAGMLELADSTMIDVPSPKIDSSFANGVFDFDAFNDRNESPTKTEISPLIKEVLENEPFSTPVMKGSVKRGRSATPELAEVKHRRVTKNEPISQTTQAAVPDWVKDFDSDLINELKGYVDFED
jgi:ATP-dependent DNA helicase HFM1/MER3